MLKKSCLDSHNFYFFLHQASLTFFYFNFIMPPYVFGKLSTFSTLGVTLKTHVFKKIH